MEPWRLKTDAWNVQHALKHWKHMCYVRIEYPDEGIVIEDHGVWCVSAGATPSNFHVTSEKRHYMFNASTPMRSWRGVPGRTYFTWPPGAVITIWG